MQQVIKTLHMQHDLEIAERQKVKKQGRDDHLKQWDGTEGWSMTGHP